MYDSGVHNVMIVNSCSNITFITYDANCSVAKHYYETVLDLLKESGITNKLSHAWWANDSAIYFWIKKMYRTTKVTLCWFLHPMLKIPLMLVFLFRLKQCEKLRVIACNYLLVICKCWSLNNAQEIDTLSFAYPQQLEQHLLQLFEQFLELFPVVQVTLPVKQISGTFDKEIHTNIWTCFSRSFFWALIFWLYLKYMPSSS